MPRVVDPPAISAAYCSRSASRAAALCRSYASASVPTTPDERPLSSAVHAIGSYCAIEMSPVTRAPSIPVVLAMALRHRGSLPNSDAASRASASTRPASAAPCTSVSWAVTPRRACSGVGVPRLRNSGESARSLVSSAS